MNHDEKWMLAALEFAQQAYDLDEVPVGAVVVRDNQLIASGYNRRETDKSGLAHAELLAIEDACKSLGGWRLAGCELFVTLEPCPMCGGAVINSRIPRLVFGASDPKAGCFGSLTDFNQLAFNHKPEVLGGVLADESAALLKKFFRELRQR